MEYYFVPRGMCDEELLERLRRAQRTMNLLIVDGPEQAALALETLTGGHAGDGIMVLAGDDAGVQIPVLNRIRSLGVGIQAMTGAEILNQLIRQR